MQAVSLYKSPTTKMFVQMEHTLNTPIFCHKWSMHRTVRMFLCINQLLRAITFMHLYGCSLSGDRPTMFRSQITCTLIFWHIFMVHINKLIFTWSPHRNMTKVNSTSYICEPEHHHELILILLFSHTTRKLDVPTGHGKSAIQFMVNHIKHIRLS